MEQANEYRKDEKDIINEVFSNSPPYYMTKSGTSTGGWNAENNLKEECYDDFATYMARATKWIDNNLEEKYGTGVTYVEPMNEPDTSYWAAGSTKQEGCTFAPGKAQSEMFRQMQTALDEEGLDNVQITGTDETALWNANNSFYKLEDDVKENMTTIGAHTYGGNDSERKTLLHTAKSYDKDLWMSEVTKGGGAHWEGSHDSMDAVNAKSQSEGIMADLKYMQLTAWIAWLVEDSEYECLQTNSNLKDAYETGWWAKEGQSIQYTIPLEKGSYKVQFGFKEWWKDYNSSRPMKASMVQGETKTELGTTNTWNGGNWWNDAEYEITCETAGDVTFEIAKNGDLDPVLSFIKIQKVLDTEVLKAVLAQAAQVDRSQYSVEKLKVLDQTVEEGHPLLYKAEATQKLIEEATDKIQTALDALEADTGIELTQEEIEANDYVLYTVNCGTPDVSVLPNLESERMGLLQSSFDQPYGEDKEKETTWGLNPENEFSKAEKYQANATDIGDSFIYMSENVTFDKDKSTLGYSFEVPDTMEGMEEDTYEVTVAFKLPNWDKRVVNVMLEGSTVATDISLEQNSWVSRTFTTKVTDGELNVLVKAPRRTSTKQDPILNYIKVRAVKDTEPVIPNYTSFTGVADETMYDTNGNQIQAHGGQIQKLTVDGVTKWYWIGEDKTNDYRPCGGIHMYSSEDLYNWKDEGVVLKAMESMEQFESDPYFKELYGNETQEQKEEVFVDLDKNNCVMERPKMLYNEKTDKYVIWFHADGRYPGSDADYGKAKAGVAIGDSPTGPFKLLGSYKLDYDKSENPNYGYDGWEGTEEIQELSKAYNTMLERINQYIEERMKIQEEKRNAEIHALQMQINPHYMYNTLASIKWLTWQGDVKKSTAVIDAFISLLRNTISNTDEFVTVEQEVANLKNYVLINQTRYGDAVGVEFYVVDKCKEYLVPKLILQPFVENAFFHAFPEGMEGEISVFIKEEKKYLRFDIEDNGVGMDAEQLYTLNNKKDKKSEHFTGIGINNVDDSIKLIYGMDYGINIVSEKDKGTTITILLPRKEKEHGNSI